MTHLICLQPFFKQSLFLGATCLLTLFLGLSFGSRPAWAQAPQDVVLPVEYRQLYQQYLSGQITEGELLSQIPAQYRAIAQQLLDTAAGQPTGGAQGPTTDLETSVTALNFFQKDIGSFITPLVETALIVGSILVLMYLLWGGIEWITSGGDKSKYESARNRITAALMGLAIMASAWSIWLFVNYFLGIDKIIKISDGQDRPVSGTPRLQDTLRRSPTPGETFPGDGSTDVQRLRSQ